MIKNITILLLLSLSYSATLLVPDQYPTIQDAIDAANPGDEVLVSEGIYIENLLIEKDLQLHSVNGMSTTTIDGSNGGPGTGKYGSTIVVRPMSNDTHHPIVEISGFTIQNGTGTIMKREVEVSIPGGGTDTVLVDVKLGGGIYAYVCTPKVINNKFKQNGNDDTDEGGAVHATDEPEDTPFPTRDDYVNHPDLPPATGDLDFSQNEFQINDADFGSSVYIKGFNNYTTDLTEGHFDVYDCENQEVPSYWVYSLQSEVDAQGGSWDHCLNPNQTDYYVSVEGNDNFDGTPEFPFLTIEKVLSIINPEEFNPITIHLSEGTFSPSSTGEEFPIIMISNLNLIGQGEELTTLDAAFLSTVLIIDNCINNTISNLSIIKGFGNTNAGGILIQSSNPILSNITLDNNLAGNGGGMQLIQSSPIMTNMTIANNTATYAGGGMDILYYSNPVLNEVTIENNIADSSCENDNCGWGGGILLMSYSEPIFNNVLIKGNSANRNGGGMLIEDSDPEFNNVIISENSAANGGGIHFWDTEATLTGLTIINNNAEDEGGGISIEQSDVTLINSIIDGNSSNGNGGGIISWHSSLSATNVIITNNIAAVWSGGGIYLYQTEATLTDLIITDNVAKESGGGIVIDESDNVTLTDINIDGNSAKSCGGGMGIWDSSPVLTNITITNNSAVWCGGGIEIYGGEILIEDSDPEFNNVIISENSAVNGGGIHCWDTKATLTGLTIMNNNAEEGGGIGIEQSDVTLINSIIDGNSSNGNGGGIGSWHSSLSATNVIITNNIAAVWSGGGIYLYQTEATLTDLIITDNVAKESGGGIVIDESDNVTLTDINIDGNSAKDCGGGMGLWDSSPVLTNITITNNSAVWCGGGIEIVRSNPITQDIIVSGNISQWGGGIQLWNCASTILSNIYLTNNEAREGGGLASYNKLDSPSFDYFEFELNNVMIMNNIAEQGAGIELSNSRSTLNNVTISFNYAKDDGGGISIESSTAYLNNVDIVQNIADDDGGGIFFGSYDNSNFPLASTFTNVIISENVANNNGRGGGIYFHHDTELSLATEVVITNNYSSGAGGGIFLSAGSNINLQNSTIAGNMVGKGDVFGAGIYADGGTAKLINSIVYYNRREGDYGPNYNLNGWSQELSLEYDISYSDIEGDEIWVPVGVGNISLDPEFVDFENSGNFTLQSTSPCIDTGTADTDGDGEEDITDYFGSAPDMGAFEFGESSLNGDLNADGIVNIQDIVILINIILGGTDPNDAGDLNADGVINVQDVVILVNIILQV